MPGGPGRVVEAVAAALIADGFDVEMVRSPAEHSGEFAQLQVSREGHTTQLDLGRDSRAHDAVTLEFGPVLHFEDAVGSKVTALLGRGLPLKLGPKALRFELHAVEAWLDDRRTRCATPVSGVIIE